MTVAEFALGLVCLLVLLGGATYAAVGLAARFLPFGGVRRRLAEVVGVLTLIVLCGQVLGLLAALDRIPLVLAGAACAGLGVWARRGPRAEVAAETGAGARVPTALVVIAIAAVSVTSAAWLVTAQDKLSPGPQNEDTLWYHGPLAGAIAQSGSIRHIHFVQSDPLFGSAKPGDEEYAGMPPSFFPENGELLQATGIVLFDRDILLPLLSLAWLALALLAVFCAAPDRTRGAVALTGAAAVFGTHIMVDQQAGEALTDLLAVGLMLAAYGIWRAAPRDRAAVAWAAVAAGLALGTKLTVAVPLAVIVIGAIWLAPRERRLGDTGVWAAGLAIPSVVWFARSLFQAGTPVPYVDHVGPIGLPGPTSVWLEEQGDSLGHWIGDGNAWDKIIHPGLEIAWGKYWWALLVVVVAAALYAFARPGSREIRVAALAALAAWFAYAFLLPTGSGDGGPLLFTVTTRYALPAILLGIVAGASALPAKGRWPVLAAAAFALLLGIDVADGGVFPDSGSRAAAGALAAAALGAAALAGVLTAPGWSATTRRVVAGGIGVVLVLALFGAERTYLDNRYALGAAPSKAVYWDGLRPVYAWAREEHDQRIGIQGFVYQYPLLGKDISNRVQHIGNSDGEGDWNPPHSCKEWKRTVNAGRYGWLVFAPPGGVAREGDPAPEAKWAAADPAAQSRQMGVTTLVRLAGPLDPARCPKGAQIARRDRPRDLQGLRHPRHRG